MTNKFYIITKLKVGNILERLSLLYYKKIFYYYLPFVRKFLIAKNKLINSFLKIKTRYKFINT